MQIPYLGGFVYEDNQLEFVQTAEGRAVPNGASFDYEYYLKDHLGNTRVAFNEAGEVMQETHYYPFGLRLKGGAWQQSGASRNKYLYNGKELEGEDLGLNWFDYGARRYDPQLGRWHSVDPVDEFHSPYVYVANNPIMLIDPDGSEVASVFNKSNGTLQIRDLDLYVPGLPDIIVGPDEYQMNGIRDEAGSLVFNQVLIIQNVFSGGQVDAMGNITRDLLNNPALIPIPNAYYDILDYEKFSTQFKLDPIDSDRYNDVYDVQGVFNSEGTLRFGFRLHAGYQSEGCVTGCQPYGTTREDWKVVNSIIRNTSFKYVPKREGDQRYLPWGRRKDFGTLKVVGKDNL